MKKLFILTILVASLVLTGCSQQVVKETPDEVDNNQNDAKIITESDKVEIIKAFREKYPDYAQGDDESQFEIKVSNEVGGEFMRGIMSIKGKEMHSTPYFLTVKRNGNWEVPLVSQDYPVCQEIEEYNFPSSIVPKCYDNEKKALIGLGSVGNDKIKVFNIEDNQTVVSPLTISGQGVAFENNLQVELRNSDHVALVKEFTTIKSGEVSEMGDYSITLNFQFNNTKEGYIAVYEQSAEDGSELNLVEIPVKFGVEEKE